MKLDAFENDLGSLKCLSIENIAELNMGGFHSVLELAGVTLDDIAVVRGIGAKLAVRISNELETRGLKLPS